MGLDLTKTASSGYDQLDIKVLLNNYFLDNKIKVIFYKGGIFEKYFISSLNLFGVDILDLEHSPYFVPPSRFIAIKIECFESSQCCLHKTNSSHCAIKDVLNYYNFIRCCDYLNPFWPVIKTLGLIKNY